jgi:3-deoxy-D-manno-octulosonic-acid transferase
VGEVYVAFRFIDELRRRDPQRSFVITTTTSTGYSIAESRIHPDDVLLYYPADFPFVVRRALRIINPQAFILTECELWPNMIRHLSQKGIPITLINGRISDSSYKGYKALSRFFSPTVRAINLLLVQTIAEQNRLLSLGANPDRIKVMGSAKYDVAQPVSSAEELGRQALRSTEIDPDSPLVVGGSTWDGEEAILLDIHARLKESFNNLKLVLVPRHAERRKDVMAEIEKRHISFALRSKPTDQKPTGITPPDVLLVDTTGELRNFYACASVIFVGKSLTNHGGQNIIEPAAFSKAIVVGPNMENFPVVMTDFLAAQAIIQVQDAAALEDTIRNLLNNPALRDDHGRRAGALVKEKQGVVSNSVDLMLNAWTRDEDVASASQE